jgi:glycine/D-amino acid oxidase-like deaminating enzyme
MMFDSQRRLVASLLPPRRDAVSAAEVARNFEAKLRRIFPHLPWNDMPRIEWEHFWLGTVGVTTTRVPCALRLAPRLHSIGGYSGQGMTAAIAAGREYAQFICEGGVEQSCRLPFMDPRSVPLRRSLPRLMRCAIAPLIRATDKTYRREENSPRHLLNERCPPASIRRVHQ